MRPLAACALLLLLQPQDQKLPVPSVADQKKTEAEIRSLFREDFAKKTRDGKRALAQKLLKEAADEKNSTVGRFVVLILSRDLAVEALDVPTLFSAIDQMARLYEVEKPPLTGAAFTSSSNALKIFCLNNAQKSASGPEDSSSLSEAYLRVAEDTLKDRLFDDALSAAQAAEKYARSSKAAAVADRSGQLVKEIPELKKEDEAFANIITTKVDDPAAKLVKGRYSLFVIGDEKAAIDNLLVCSDDGLKSVSRLESLKPASSEAMLDVAEAWLTLAKKEESPLHKHRYQDRARGWFDEALKNAGGLLRAKIEKRLAEIGPTGAGSAGGKKVDLLAMIDLKKDTVAGTWKIDGKALVGSGGKAVNKLLIPYIPPDEYDLSIVAERKSGDEGVFVGMARGSTQWLLALDNYAGEGCKSGLEYLDGRICKENATAVSGRQLPSSKKVAIDCRVRKTGVRVSVDGKVIIDWQGDFAKLALSDVWKTTDSKSLFLGVYDCQVSFAQLTLLPISGQGKRLH
jgi:hypothetical protein